jgi:hypothetical protein
MHKYNKNIHSPYASEVEGCKVVIILDINLSVMLFDQIEHCLNTPVLSGLILSDRRSLIVSSDPVIAARCKLLNPNPELSESNDPELISDK